MDSPIKEPTEARRCLSLDYISDSQIAALFRGIRNKDFAVSIIVLVSILIKALIIVSTGLTTLSWININHQIQPMKTLDGFQVGDIQLPVSAPLASYVFKGLIDYNLTYPDGISSDYAFQSVVAETDIIPDQAEIQTTVDALENTFHCQPIGVHLELDGPSLPWPDQKNARGSPPDMKLVFQAPACGNQTLRFYSPKWSCGQSETMVVGNTCTVKFARADSFPCGSQSMLAIFGELTYTFTGNETKQPFLVELERSIQILCTALIARGNLLELMPEDAAWMRVENVLAGFPEGMRLRMGWSKMEVLKGGDEVVEKVGQSTAIEGAGLMEEVKTVERYGIIAVFEDM